MNTSSATTQDTTQSEPTQHPVVLVKAFGSTLKSIPCDFCERGMPTNHVCRHSFSHGTRVIEDDLDNRICGMAMCLHCREESGFPEISNQCFIHNPNAKNKKRPRTNDNVHCQRISLSSTTTVPNISDSNNTLSPSTSPSPSSLSSTIPSPSSVSVTLQSNISSTISNNTPSLSDSSTSSSFHPSLSQYSSSTLTCSNEEIKQKNKVYRKYKYRCCYKGCNNNDTTPSISLSRIPPPQKSTIPDLETSRLNKIKTYLKKEQHHNTFMKRIGLSSSDFKDGMRMCSEHEMEKGFKKCIKFNRKNRSIKLDLTFDVPKGIGVFYQNETQKGTRTNTAMDRALINKWDKRHEEMREKYGESPAKRIVE